MSILGSVERPLRVAIIGSGPSGFYVAETLFKASIQVKVDMFEKFPTPFGLVRYGVAPDHEKIKKVIKVFEKISQHPNYSFLGNVSVGERISVHDLRKFYDAVVLAYGAESDRHLNIAGESLKGSYTATQFVAWYNGHPDFQDLKFDFSSEVAVIMGQGNVAIDVARVLCKTPDELKMTDITQQALATLAESKIKEVHMYGRRGPLQAAFTLGEIKEMGDLADCYPVVSPQELQLNETSLKEIENPANVSHKKNYEVLQQFLTIPPNNRKRKFFIHFYRTPVELIGNDHVQKVKFEINQLVGEANQQKIKGTGQFEEIGCGIFLRSVGYTGMPLKGVPFSQEMGIIPNKDGRVMGQGEVLKGLYVAGWIKTGAVGTIGANKPGSQETVECLLQDMPQIVPCEVPSTQKVIDFLKVKGERVVTFADWSKIDVLEIKEGKKSGKPREKITRVSTMISVVNS